MGFAGVGYDAPLEEGRVAHAVGSRKGEREDGEWGGQGC